jgi:23S rRNA (adenine2503-C2)-methyltransferase
MKTLYDYTYDQLGELMLSIGEKKYRGQQLFEWLYRKRVTTFDDMSDISLKMKTWLHENVQLSPITLKTRQVAADGTVKYLFAMEDGALCETVLMHYSYGKSLCVSSQIGCNMGCTFCASGLLKKTRNLSSGEMVAQVLYVQQELDKEQERVSHVVVMGTGEPFDNYDNVLNFLYTINHDRGLAIGARHLTVSTCGLVEGIRKFANEPIQVNLAISLHAPNDELRSKLMPINQAHPLDKLMEAMSYYMSKSNRRITYEYILLQGVNDSDVHARQLADLIRGQNAYVNLIPYNPVDEHGFRKVGVKEALHFYDQLHKAGVKCTLRQEHGADIDAACGQLRAKHERKR